jgi:type II secretory pathway pseudopilin PulG
MRGIAHRARQDVGRPHVLHTHSGRVALTLVELLIAMAILVVVTTSSMVIFRGITRAWRAGELRTERYQQARLLFDLFNRELASCVANVRFPLIGLDSAQEERLNEASVADEIFFVGTLPGRAGLVERGYWLNGQQQLMCHDDEPADGEYRTGASEVCGTQITEFDVSYFDGTTWLNSWDARPLAPQAAQLPSAVHLVLGIGRENSKRYETVIYVPTS